MAARDRWGREAFQLSDGSAQPTATKSMSLDTIEGWAVGIKGLAAERRRPTSAQTSSRPSRDILRTSDIEKAAPTPQTRQIVVAPPEPPPHRPSTATGPRRAAATAAAAASSDAPLNDEVSAVYKYSTMHRPLWRLNVAGETFRSHHNPLTPHYPETSVAALPGAEQHGERFRPVADSSGVHQCLSAASPRGPKCSTPHKRVPARAWGVYSIKHLAADEIAIRAGWVGALETDPLPPPTPKIRAPHADVEAAPVRRGVRAAPDPQRRHTQVAGDRRDTMRWFDEVHALRVAAYHGTISTSRGPAASEESRGTHHRPQSARNIASGAESSDTRPSEVVRKLTDEFVHNVHRKAVAGSQADAYFAMQALSFVGNSS
jgi:hypothetical protein